MENSSPLRTPIKQRRLSVASAHDSQLRTAASRGKLHEVRTLLANGAPVTKDGVSRCYGPKHVLTCSL